LDLAGQTIEFLLTAKRDGAAAKRFLPRAIEASGCSIPRAMNPAYPAAVETLKADGVISHRVCSHQCKYFSNVIEQDHRMVKSGFWLTKG
jgi:transposase, IS6 family